MPKHKYQTYTLYSLHIPILLLLIGLVATAGYMGLQATEANSEMGFDKELSAVLGDDDKDEDDNSGKGSKDKDDDKDDDRDDDKDDDRDDDKGDDRNTEYKEAAYEESKTTERIQNEDGTITIKETETEDDGEIKVEIRTYDANGNKIRVEKYESDEGEEKSRVKVYDEFGNKLSDFRLETEDGKELELKLKEGETELSRVRFDLEKQELVVKTGELESQNSDDSTNEKNEVEDNNRIRIRLAGNSFVVTRNGVEALSMFPLTVDDETGDIFVNTPVGLIELNAMPDSIVQRAQLSDDIDDVTSVELGTSDENTTLEYILVGEKREKLLGLFELQIPVELIYDAESGDFLEAGERSFRTKILELFSF